MRSDKLIEAREYEIENESRIASGERPLFHLTPRVGWLNDPNGFSYYDGKYHLFYQYYPYDSHWGPMHWGHVVSEDLLHWEYLPAAMAPDEDYDNAGVFSGSAITLPDGRHLLIYTGVIMEDDKEVQRQCVAVGDGIEYKKYEHNPVLDEKDIPEGSSRNDFRDPKIWQNKDGTYSCAVGSRPADGSGQILLYNSPDGFKWSFKSILCANNDRYGKMWECPDFFELDGEHVLLVSPQDMLPQGFEYHNGNGTVCFIGSYDEQMGKFLEEHNQAIDYGLDFYAPQTVLTPDGRRVMIGWMQNWDTCNLHKPTESWQGQMSLPRELSIKNGRLYQQPIRELLSLRTDEVRYQDVVFSDTLKLTGIKGRKIDMELEIRPINENEVYNQFIIFFAQNEQYHTSLGFRPKESILKIDRKFSGSRRAIIHQRRSLINHENGKIKLRMILDRFSVEVFVNDGEQVLSATIFTDQSADGITFLADGKVAMDVVKYDLVSQKES